MSKPNIYLDREESASSALHEEFVSEYFVVKFPSDGTNKIGTGATQRCTGARETTPMTHPPRSAHDDATRIVFFPASQPEPPGRRCCRGNGALTAEEAVAASGGGEKNGGRAAVKYRLENDDTAAV